MSEKYSTRKKSDEKSIKKSGKYSNRVKKYQDNIVLK